jgi:hypothetical protein
MSQRPGIRNFVHVPEAWNQELLTAIDDASDALQRHRCRWRNLDDVIAGNENGEVAPPDAALDVEYRDVRERSIRRSRYNDFARRRGRKRERKWKETVHASATGGGAHGSRKV